MKKTFITAALIVALGGTAAFALIREGTCGNSCQDKAGSACTSRAHKATVSKASLQGDTKASCPDKPGCICSH